MVVRPSVMLAMALGAGLSCELAAAPALDFGYFKDRIEGRLLSADVAQQADRRP